MHGWGNPQNRMLEFVVRLKDFGCDYFRSSSNARMLFFNELQTDWIVLQTVIGF
jgi:hypothetical protein